MAPKFYTNGATTDYFEGPTKPASHRMDFYVDNIFINSVQGTPP